MLLEVAATVLLANAHSGKLLAGKPVTITAHPGSAIKPFVLQALPEIKEPYYCPGKLTIDGRSFTCSHPRIPAGIDSRTALAYSCNNFFAHYAAQLPRGALAKTLARYGLVGASDRLVEALGEGSLTVTPSQMLEAYRRLALESNPTVAAGLRDAVRYGTGQLAEVTGLLVAGKTGTASPSYAWFAGWAPASKPEYVFAILTRQGSGGTGAAPLAREALLHELGRDRDLAVLTSKGLQTMSLDDYVAGVLGGEASDLHSPEALKAMAIAARTFAVKLRGRHAEDGYDFCGTTHCQSFRPALTTSSIRSAIDETAGELLWRDGALAETFYSQDCTSQWSAKLTEAEVRKALNTARLHDPPAFAIHAIKRDAQGRVLELDLGDGVPIAAGSFRFAIGRTLGWNRIRSDFYDVSDLTFTGHGAGNGVGLCQHEADRMTGSFKQILGAFYPGTRTGLTAQGFDWQVLSGERVELWSTHSREDRELIAMAEREMRFAEETTGWHFASKPRLQVFPSVNGFRDSTGKPGSVAASTKGRIIRLQPAARNASILRHELLHLLIEEHSRASLPLWYREGIALALAGGAKPTDTNYAAYRSKVEDAIRQHCKQTVLAWATSGVP